ncbi:MAG: hypothetical protein VCC00_12210 [Deltaproteobacteria bacterium]
MSARAEEGIFRWLTLPEAGLMATALCVRRPEIAFLKHMFESCEGLGFTRMVSVSDDREFATLAIVATPDYVSEATELLASLLAHGGFFLAPTDLPKVCREDWFLSEWRTSSTG